ncbi:hypothetical protein TRICI_002433 [Trichomonascus ciferrii]|uniref:Small acidic protein-like domain-containing protein n=1 Tax=Trichomonascus ciferrii TaxID=44093 RepID=A0A642VBP6_9ASCO|nr:hypothetical protein TRICI_002433 [Trichomonascus ciferrii]
MGKRKFATEPDERAEPVKKVKKQEKYLREKLKRQQNREFRGRIAKEHGAEEPKTNEQIDAEREKKREEKKARKLARAERKQEEKKQEAERIAQQKERKKFKAEKRKALKEARRLKKAESAQVEDKEAEKDQNGASNDEGDDLKESDPEEPQRKKKKSKGEKKSKKSKVDEEEEPKKKKSKEEKKDKEEKKAKKDKKETESKSIPVDGLDDDQQSKYLRLMGAKKSSKDIKVTKNADKASTKEDLERQYEQGINLKQNKRTGLGGL